ncbi:nucleotide-binding universal stress UspA family protein [Streptomyces umbrinus]|uniref:Nucleotide-binding universal stress UspA family protein n=1 Tax=Streptomyces umbrinus TaxID=67370 RepID=A0ABU0TAH0_9ACTN|nr:universal stress protein [Streptomyces umbrinus]MDQ1032809.1 nucleotide-binding universal stress UspA family protein [Streptomyces umbrinus]
MTTRHVIVGVDGSVVAVRALDLAADEAALRATALEIVYAVPDLDEAGPVLASAASRVGYRHPGLPVVTVPAEGHSVAVLAERGRWAALTVVGCRSLGGFAGTVFGSVSRRLAAHAPGPLLVVRGDSPPHLHNEVLLVLDEEDDADTAASAFQEAELRGASLRIFRLSADRHPVPVPVPVSHRRSEWTASYLPAGDPSSALRDRHPLVRVGSRDAAAASTQTLLEATRTADLVVTACRPERSGHGRHLGSLARMLLQRAHCPVLLVPAGQESAAPSTS